MKYTYIHKPIHTSLDGPPFIHYVYTLIHAYIQFEIGPPVLKNLTITATSCAALHYTRTHITHIIDIIPILNKIISLPRYPSPMPAPDSDPF